jgi:hypothetical protein
MSDKLHQMSPMPESVSPTNVMICFIGRKTVPINPIINRTDAITGSSPTMIVEIPNMISPIRKMEKEIMVALIAVLALSWASSSSVRLLDKKAPE